MAEPDKEEIPSLLKLTETVHQLAAHDRVERLGVLLAMGAEKGITTCIGARIAEEDKFDGIVFVLVGPKVKAADAEAFMDYAKMMLQDIDPAAAKNFVKNAS